MDEPVSFEPGLEVTCGECGAVMGTVLAVNTSSGGVHVDADLDVDYTVHREDCRIGDVFMAGNRRHVVLGDPPATHRVGFSLPGLFPIPAPRPD